MRLVRGGKRGSRDHATKRATVNYLNINLLTMSFTRAVDTVSSACLGNAEHSIELQ